MSILKPWLFLEEEEPGSGILGRVTLSEPRTQNRFPFSSIHRKTMYSTLCMCVCYVIVILLQFLSDKNYPKILTPRALQTPSTKEFLHILNVSVNIKKKTDMLYVIALIEVISPPPTKMNNC